MKRIIWDWNGTLFDDVDLCFHVINRLLKKYDRTPLETIQDYRNVFEFPVINYYQTIGFDFEQTPFDQLAEEYMADYQPKSTSCTLRADAMYALNKAKEYGFGQCILSASETHNLMEQVQRLQIESVFDEIFSIDNQYAHGKAELARRCKEMFPDDELWLVGDTFHDREVAHIMDANCLLVCGGHQNVEQSEPVMDSLTECVERINETTGN